MTTLISINKIIEFIKENYDLIYLTDKEVYIEEFVQGYMNRVFMVEIKGETNSRKYSFLIFNHGRYYGEAGRNIITDIQKFVQYLRSENMPVPNYVLNCKGSTITEWKINNISHFVSIYEYIEGNTISWEGYTRKHLRSLGQMLAKYHELSKRYMVKLTSIKNFKDYYYNDFSKLAKYFKENELSIASKLNVKICQKFFNQNNIKIILSIEEIKENLYAHCDFVRGNILFSDIKDKYIFEISGVLDFEKLLYGPKLLDIARTLAFLYVDCRYKTYLEVNRYFLYEGYLTLGTGKIENNNYLENYMIYFWLRDLWKFLSCNPYEALKENDHYTRTINLLIEKGIFKNI